MHDREYEDLSLEQQAEVSMKVDQFTIRENESLPNNLLIVNTKNIPESLEIVREITQEINRSLQTRNKSAIDTLVDSAIAKEFGCPQCTDTDGRALTEFSSYPFNAIGTPGGNGQDRA